MGSHVNRSRLLEFDAAPDRVRTLFTAEGERDWVVGWDPTHIWPTDGTPQEGAVFTTDHHGETTTWCLAELDYGAGRFRYVATHVSRVTLVLVEVSASPVKPGHSQVRVTYSVVATDEDGESMVARFDEHFDDMMSRWRAGISAVLT